MSDNTIENNRTVWTREFQYLLSVCQPQHIPSEAGWHESYFAELNWQRVLELAASHRILPQLQQKLSQTADVHCPADVRAVLHTKARTMLHRSLLLSAELLRIVKQLNQAGIDCLTMKGATLAQLAYGSVASRTFSDLDILVSAADFRRSTQCLADLGFRTDKNLDPEQEEFQIRTKGEIHFSNPSGILVDLHTNLNRGTYAYRATWDELWANRQTVNIQGAQLATFGANDLFLYLAIHGAKHRWIQLNWILDFAQALKLCDLEQAFLASERVGERKVCELALLVCQATFGLPASLNIVPDRRQAAALAVLRRDLEHKASTESRFSELMYLCKARQRPLAAIWATIAEITQPHMTDWNAVRLPRMLWFCYVLLRPLRLISKRLIGQPRRD